MSLLRKPSAFLPMVMSVAALATVQIYVVVFGIAQQPDEGAAAHVWQLLMAAQFPIIGYFAIRWLPAEPRKALAVLALQLGAGLAAAAPVFLLRF
ncbi:MAG: hypothetical protein ABIQ99_03285 [Thermoflexales bacterium]